MAHQIPQRGGDEYDAFSQKARRMLHWRPGVLRAIKRRYWKRVRKFARLEISAKQQDCR